LSRLRSVKSPSTRYVGLKIAMHFRIALPKFQPALPIAHPHFPIKVFDAANLQVNFNLNVCHDNLTQPRLTSIPGLRNGIPGRLWDQMK
jgi:hypothetical protein